MGWNNTPNGATASACLSFANDARTSTCQSPRTATHCASTPTPRGYSACCARLAAIASLNGRSGNAGSTSGAGVWSPSGVSIRLARASRRAGASLARRSSR
ncbi:hypothetical protein G6F62_015471 [Rhizopus arrhizus]|nr:hypothetical protein G6F62_015471 [Rhizopus arrhizus]